MHTEMPGMSFAASAGEMGFAPGTVFAGRYEIVAPLGRGGMGSVYRAQHVGLRREVALKILGASLITDGEARFEREARAIAKLDHPSCVRILDYGRTKRHQFIAMQLLDGPTLAQLLAAEGRTSTARAVQLIRNVLSALAHAHDRGVLHRDIKPENVMVVGATPHAAGAGPSHGRAVLIDFGLAHLLDDAPLTARGMCIGSPSYLAPERLDGAPHDERADLYAVGVMLYELLAGTRPFVGSSVGEILFQVRTRPPRPLRAIRSDVSQPLEALVVRALAKDPARRFATAEDMLSALDEVPVLEELAEIAMSERREEVATTLVNLPLVDERPSLWTRIWARLRFGRWRWSIASH
jgi:eukaryotic-like serine/threonine-protein kinase